MPGGRQPSGFHRENPDTSRGMSPATDARPASGEAQGPYPSVEQKLHTSPPPLLPVSEVPAISRRARALGIPLDGIPGPQNAVTDLSGVQVGHVILIQEDDPRSGRGAARTAVTVILPRGKDSSPSFAEWFSLNGNGELTGTAWIDESGLLDRPL